MMIIDALMLSDCEMEIYNKYKLERDSYMNCVMNQFEDY